MSIRNFRPLRRALTPASARVALPALLLLALAGCAVLEPEPAAADRRALSRARALWARTGPSSYRYVYSPRCDCASSYLRDTWITVEKGVVTRAEYVQGSDPVNAGPQVFSTVDSLFALVQRAYDNHAAAVRVTYDPALGYPADVWIDWRRDLADDENGFAATALAPYLATR